MEKFWKLDKTQTFALFNAVDKHDLVKSMFTIMSLLNDEEHASALDFIACYNDEIRDNFESLATSLNDDDVTAMVETFLYVMYNEYKAIR